MGALNPLAATNRINKRFEPLSFCENWIEPSRWSVVRLGARSKSLYRERLGAWACFPTRVRHDRCL